MFVWTFGDIVRGVIIGLAIIIWLGITLNDFFSKHFCKHNEGVNETQACDAICRKCGKNLGFIGTWSENEIKRRKADADKGL